MNTTRHRHPLYRRLLAAALVFAVPVALTACGSGTDSGPAEGFQRVEAGWMQVDVPDGWVDTGAADETWTSSYQDVEGDDPAYQLLLAPEYAKDTALGATSTIVGWAQVGAFPDFRIVKQVDPTREEDFKHYKRIRFTYTGYDEVTYEAVLWGVADDEKHAVLAQLTGQDLDDELVQAVGDSIVVTGE
ncbi:hypothetical protein [Isoptericola croceus]|uniref:hypothetical protein n=1 Tax=Isoptericola croceus TaxID=3031406 RepID=UPI0023F70256|nr:hypothetical protein [Isoptericola croceus]